MCKVLYCFTLPQATSLLGDLTHARGVPHRALIVTRLMNSAKPFTARGDQVAMAMIFGPWQGDQLFLHKQSQGTFEGGTVGKGINLTEFLSESNILKVLHVASKLI